MPDPSIPSKVTNIDAYDRGVRAIVTGGAGFIGSHVVEALVARGDEVHVVDDLSPRPPREPARRRAAARARTSASRSASCSPSSARRSSSTWRRRSTSASRSPTRSPTRTPTSSGRSRSSRRARPIGAKVIFTSTGGAIYGECDRPAAETAPRLPLSPYGTSKLAAEEYLRRWNRLYGTRHVALRLGNVYGPRQDPHGEAGVVAIFLQRLREGAPVTIFGDGSRRRDYVYAGDVAEAMLAAENADGGVFNVGTGVETSVLELWEACCRAAGSTTSAELAEPRLGELQRSFLDPTAAERELGFGAATSLDDGLRATWEWLTA